MSSRTSFFQLLLVAVAMTATVIGCGSPGTIRSALPPGAQGAAPSQGLADPDALLEQAVVRAQGKVASTAGYTVLDDGWYQPSPAPGKPGYYLIDGEVVKGPPDDSPPGEEHLVPQAVVEGVPAPAATQNCNAFNGYVPPPCTSTGPFRRVYSGPGYSYALATLILPATITTMPTAPPWSGTGPTPTPVPNGDTGFVYFEGWVTKNTSGGNSEFGFQYSALHNWYSAYFKTYSPQAQLYVQTNHWTPATPVTLAMGGYTIANQNYLHVALLGTTKEVCKNSPYTSPVSPNLCLAHAHSLNAGWTPSGCCIMARMTSIGQVLPNKFYDGVAFGPIMWSKAELAASVPTPNPGSTTLPFNTKDPAWSGGGSQNWPPYLNKIVVTDATNTGETDTLNLTALPKLSVSLNPSGCQHFALSGTVSYTAAMTGDPSGLTVKYGWVDPTGLSTPPPGFTSTLTVPGATLTSGNQPAGQDPQGKMYIGVNSTSATDTAAAKKNTSFTSGTRVYLYYVDATGKLTSDWNGTTVQSAGDLITLSNYPCPGAAAAAGPM